MAPPQICIIALIGLPAVGKTTFSKLLMEIETLPFNILHICYDDFLSSNPNNATMSYKEQRDYLLKSLVSTIESLKSSKTFGSTTDLLNHQSCCYKEGGGDYDRVVIICDDNHYYMSMRYKLFQIARKNGLTYGQIFFECNNLEIVLRRNSLRSVADKVPEEVFQKMALFLDIPQFSLSWEKNTFIVHMDSNDKEHILSDIVPFITHLYDGALQPLTSDITSNCSVKQSRVHDLDLLIRKSIGLFMNSNVNFDKKLVAKLLNDKRKDMLKAFQTKSDFDQCLHQFDEYLAQIWKEV